MRTDNSLKTTKNKHRWFVCAQVFVVCLWFSVGVSAQRKTRVRNVKGICITRDITPEEAKLKALDNAKQNALREAGIPESVSYASVLSTSQNTSPDHTDFKQLFSEISRVEVQGAIVDWEVVDDKRSFDADGNMIVEVSINATVKQYKSKPDPSFNLQIRGIEDFYKENDKLTFSITPYREGYLHIFLLSDSAGYLLYPNAYEKTRLFNKDERFIFPLSDAIDYILKTDTEKKRTINHIVFVFTKKDVPFNQTVQYNSIISWIYAMEPEQRFIKYFSFVIIKNS